VSVVIPARNEGGNIGPLTLEVAQALERRWTFEIVVVDDGSTDATEQELARLLPENPWLRVLRHNHPSGQSAAVRTGVIAARGSIIATLDGDGQNDPAFLPQIIETLDKGGPRSGLVAGQRIERSTTGLKRIASQAANRVINGILGTSSRDTGCGLKAFRRDVFLSLPYFDGLHRFLPPLVRREGFDIAYVDVVDRPRRFGKSKYRIWDRLWISLADLLGVYWLTRRRKRVPIVTEEGRDAD
jgi:glycosyltransferase involved in cell wall biosynthesis